MPKNLVDQAIQELLYDEAEQVRGASLFQMLDNLELQSKHMKRFSDLISDTSQCTHLSKIIFVTNSWEKAPVDLVAEVEAHRKAVSGFLYSALLFHVAAQSPFLPITWREWLEAESSMNAGLPKHIIELGAWNRPGDKKIQNLFVPDWLLNYENTSDLIWYRPKYTHLTMSTGVIVTLRDVEELSLIFSLRESMPDYLAC